MVSFSLVHAQNLIAPLNSVSYDILATNNSTVKGQLFLADYGLGSSLIVISVSGASTMHPAHLHKGNCGSSGDVAVPLESVSAEGLSVSLNDIALSDILAGDHYLNIHASADDLGTIVACTEVGLNALGQNAEMAATMTVTTDVRPEEFDTLSTASYRVFSVGNSPLFGQVQLTEESSGGTKFVLTLEGHEAGNQYPVDIKAGDCGPDGELVLQLNAFPLGIIEPNASMTFTDLAIESFSEANNYITVYDQDNNVLACGEVGIGANR